MFKDQCCDNYKYQPNYDYVSCGNCGAIKLDNGSSHGIAKGMMFKTMAHARFYKKNGKRSDNDFKDD